MSFSFESKNCRKLSPLYLQVTYRLNNTRSLQRYLVIDHIASTWYSASGWRTTHEEAEDVTSLSDRR